ncbi:hypothetical protein C2S53_010655 [Perilla frutescens var. hirtella]|uniref:DRBM domain-containing protein n=1 Tax=Perilla frutescens var. hirtella TaxID=608512 RepID=A0AAD4JAD4_PERFH|nr:hypothetical protein C2S53_010655 [Perilla frutescens var. hirtella]
MTEQEEDIICRMHKLVGDKGEGISACLNEGLLMALGPEIAVEKESVTWEVGPTNDVIQAFIETFVDPRLPYKFTIKDPPSEDVQKAIAGQMHAVVLLYNYYHRKQKLELEFVDFVSFCKLALSLRPTLASFMKAIHGSEVVELNDAEDQLSVTEKAIKNACNIAMSLDASKDVPSIEGYPISEVVVLLIDSEKENCLLQFGAVTEGAWSLIEKEIDEFNINQEILAEERVHKKRKTNDQLSLADHSKFLQIAFDAVKDVSGIEVSDLVVLEAHVVYSLNKEKSAAQFYMMKCKQSFNINERSSLESLLESLQGPFAEKFSDAWGTTALVEFHRLLPYAGLISSWLPRKDSSVPILSDFIAQCTKNKDANEITPSRISDSSLAEYSIKDLDYINNNSSEKKSSSSNIVTNEDRKDSEKKSKHFSGGKVTSSDNIFHRTERHGHATDESKTRRVIPNSTNKCTTRASFENADKDSEKHGKGSLSGRSRGQPQGVVRDDNAARRINTNDLSETPFTSGKKRATNSNMTGYHQSKNISSAQHDANGLDKGVNSKVETLGILKSTAGQYRDERITAENGGATITSNHNAIAAAEKVLIHFEVPYKTEAEKVTPSEDLQNALALLDRKRQGLYSQLCTMEDTLALYEHMIDRIRDGGEIGLAHQCIKSLISGSDPLLLKKEPQVQGKAGEDPSNPQLEKRTKFSCTFLPGRSSCQDLEYTCLKNNWRLPRYFVQPLEGKFLSNVIVCTGSTLTSKGGLESSPLEARESAAAQMIVKIRALVIKDD